MQKVICFIFLYTKHMKINLIYLCTAFYAMLISSTPQPFTAAAEAASYNSKINSPHSFSFFFFCLGSFYLSPLGLSFPVAIALATVFLRTQFISPKPEYQAFSSSAVVEQIKLLHAHAKQVAQTVICLATQLQV